MYCVLWSSTRENFLVPSALPFVWEGTPDGATSFVKDAPPALVRPCSVLRSVRHVVGGGDSPGLILELLWVVCLFYLLDIFQYDLHSTCGWPISRVPWER